MYFIDREKNLVDFFVNTSFVFLVISLEFICLYFFKLEFWFLIISGIALVFSYFSYSLSVQCTVYWGDTIKTAFDLYRYDLAKILRLKKFRNGFEEFQAWQSVSDFFNTNKSIINSPIIEHILYDDQTERSQP